MPRLSTTALFAAMAICWVLPSMGDERTNPPQTENQQALYEKFESTLSGVKLIGRFTVIGKEDRPPTEEEYTISKVTKLEKGDYWLFAARIKYGQKDYTVPLPLEVKWADDTPMITLTNLEILGQGPFSARVIFHDDKYAGTWSHGAVGGHMFGRIVKRSQDEIPANTDVPPK